MGPWAHMAPCARASGPGRRLRADQDCAPGAYINSDWVLINDISICIKTIRRPLLVRGIRLRRSGASLLFSRCGLAVAICNLLVVGPRNRADHPPGPRLPRFLALPRPSKNPQAALQYYLENNLIQEAILPSK